MYIKPFMSTCSYRILPTHVVQLLTRLDNCERLTTIALTKLCIQLSNLCFNVALCFHPRNCAWSGWTMVFKAVSGVVIPPWIVYSSPITFEEFETKALDLTNNFRKHYKSRIVTFWENFGPTKVSVYLK